MEHMCCILFLVYDNVSCDQLAIGNVIMFVGICLGFWIHAFFCVNMTAYSGFIILRMDISLCGGSGPVISFVAIFQVLVGYLV